MGVHGASPENPLSGFRIVNNLFVEVVTQLNMMQAHKADMGPDAPL